MLKGMPVNKRDIHWTKEHERKLKRDKARRKARKNKRYEGVTLEQAEKFYKAAQARKKSKWLWFISLWPIVLIRKLIYALKKD